ncbi:hypothetical protein PM082_021685, partial [Marasmius tenuissimus]
THSLLFLNPFLSVLSPCDVVSSPLPSFFLLDISSHDLCLMARFTSLSTFLLLATGQVLANLVHTIPNRYILELEETHDVFAALYQMSSDLAFPLVDPLLNPWTIIRSRYIRSPGSYFPPSYYAGLLFHLSFLLMIICTISIIVLICLYIVLELLRLASTSLNSSLASCRLIRLWAPRRAPLGRCHRLARLDLHVAIDLLIECSIYGIDIQHQT